MQARSCLPRRPPPSKIQTVVPQCLSVSGSVLGGHVWVSNALINLADTEFCIGKHGQAAPSDGFLKTVETVHKQFANSLLSRAN
jgi:hypothetical protein